MGLQNINKSNKAFLMFSAKYTQVHMAFKNLNPALATAVYRRKVFRYPYVSFGQFEMLEFFFRSK